MTPHSRQSTNHYHVFPSTCRTVPTSLMQNSEGWCTPGVVYRSPERGVLRHSIHLKWSGIVLGKYPHGVLKQPRRLCSNTNLNFLGFNARLDPISATHTTRCLLGRLSHTVIRLLAMVVPTRSVKFNDILWKSNRSAGAYVINKLS